MKTIRHFYFQNRYQWQFLGGGLGASAGVWGGLWYLTPLPAYLAWLIAISFITFAYFGLDKNLAQKKGVRIPESVLHILNGCGGFGGGLLGMLLFRHKTNFTLHFVFPLVIMGSAFLHLLLWWFLGRA